MPVEYLSLSDVVYNDFDNTLDFILKSDGTAQSLADLTQVKLIDVEGTFEIDSALSASAFDWTSLTTGKLIMKLGHESVAAGTYTCWLVLFDATNTEGVVWGTVDLRFVDI